MRSLSCLLFCAFSLTALTTAMAERNDGVLDKIKAGLEYATNYLDTARDIADLVSNSLSHKHKEKERGSKDPKAPQGPQFGPSNIVSAFFRLLGLDSQKIAAIAVNSVIFLAQMIGSLFDLKSSKPSNGRNIEDDQLPWDPMKFFTENKNERVKNLMQQAEDHELPNQLIEKVDGFDAACIRLLVCKASPVIRAAQKSLKNKTRNASRQMTAWLPSKDEFEINSNECEDKHTDCSLFPEL